MRGSGMRLSKDAWAYKKRVDAQGRGGRADADGIADASIAVAPATFEGYVNDRLAGASSEEERTRFLLDAVPFISEYDAQLRAQLEPTAAASPAPAPAPASAARPPPQTVSRLIDGEVHRNPKTILARLKVCQRDHSVDDFWLAARSDAAALDRIGSCDACNGYLVVDRATSERICTVCGKMQTGEVLLPHDIAHAIAPCDRDHVELETRFCYKRINHFNEWLTSLQGRENTNISDDVVEQVRAEFAKARLTRPEDVTQIRTRQILKKLGHAKLYEHSYHICRVLGGQSADLIPRDLEARLKTMFQQIQHPFETVKPPTRKNFLSYSYVLYKMMQLLGRDEYLPYLPLLKSSEKLFNQDKIWKGICEILHWQFIPTL